MVASKRQYIELAARGLFGNRLREWPTLKALQASDYVGPVSLRYRDPRGGASPFCRYGVEQRDVETVVAAWEEKGADRARIWANESAPDQFLTIQGEVCRRPGGLVAFLSREKVQMRKALERAEHLEGLRVLMILRGALSGPSLDDLMELLELYQDHTVEFSAYEIMLGDCPGRNTVIWECRAF